MRIVHMTIPINNKAVPKIANRVDAKYVYVRFGMPKTIARAAQMLPISSR